jgi:hypothetical protein
MGMYTEIYVNVDLKQETPDGVIRVLKAMCGKLEEGDADDALKGFPDRWHSLFSDCSYYTPRTHCKFLDYDEISKQWSLLGKGDIKNYHQEIKAFFKWILPWVDAYSGQFIGYSRYEEATKPQLYFYGEEE